MTICSRDPKPTDLERSHTYHEMNVNKDVINREK